MIVALGGIGCYGLVVEVALRHLVEVGDGLKKCFFTDKAGADDVVYVVVAVVYALGDVGGQRVVAGLRMKSKYCLISDDGMAKRVVKA